MSEQVLSTPVAPNLQILVRREKTSELFFEVSSDFLGFQSKKFGVVTLEGDAKALAQEELGRQVDGLSGLAMKDERSRENARHQLADMAVGLFLQLPEEVQKLLWSQQGQIETLEILSDEPYIPWELLKLQGRGGEEGPYLCEAFRVTRWLRDFPQTVYDLPLHAIAFVLPTDSGLPCSKGEEEDLIALVGPERVTEIEPTLSGVKTALAGGDYDGWHFSGHGSVRAQDPNRAVIILEDGVLTPESLGNARENLSRLRPLIFLNGCNTGQAGFSLTGIGGWAQQSLAAGAGAFIGTLWPVRDSKARAFAQAFYQHFLGGEPFGEAVRQARLHIRDQFPGDPAWLAYTVYAHPGTVCSTASGKPAKRDSHPSPLRIPELAWRQEISPPGALLRAEYGIVPFHGRGKEENDLSSWCMDGSPVRVRLYTGPGGMGKTRLALEIAKALRKEGWRAGFLEPEAVRSPEDAWKAISRPGGKVLAIIDYAETRRDLLIPLLRRLHAVDAGPIRLILLARAALDWWEQLKAESQGVGELLSGPATSRHALRPLAFTPQERSESYHLAGQAFAQRLNLTALGEAPEDLGDPIYERVLLLHMRALATIEGIKVKGEDGVLDYVLSREQRYWTQRVLDRKLTASVITGVSRAMAAITLGGGVKGEAEAVEVLSQLRAFRGHTGDILLAVAHLLHECYPGNRWIEPILPDLLGEHLVQRELENGADELLNLVLGPANS